MKNPNYAPQIDRAYVKDASLKERRAKLVSAARTGRRTRAELDWVVNLKWWAGEPWYRANELGTLEELQPQFRNRYANVNMSFEIVETLAGKMTYPPRVEAIPSNSDPESSFRARATADIGNHAIFVSGLYEAFAQIVKLVHICGLAWGKYGWDPSAGPMRPVEGQVTCPECKGVGGVPGWYDNHMVPCPVCSTTGVVLDPNTGAEMGPGTVQDVTGEEPRGEVFVDCCAPWEISHTPGVEDLRKVREINHSKLMSRAEAWQRYAQFAGLDEDDLIGARPTEEYPNIAWRIGSLWEKQMNDDLVVVDEYWELPSQKFPQGLYGVMVGDIVCSFGPLPYATPTLPFIPFQAYKIPGVALPKSTMDMVLPLIFIINDHISSLHARARMTSKLRVMATPTQHVNLDDEQVVVNYKHLPGVPQPKELQFGAASPDAANLIEMLKGFTERISGAVDVFRGTVPQGADSARAFAWLDEQALTRLTPMVDDHSRRLQDVIQGLVELVHIFYDEGRTLQSFGTEGHVENREFRLSEVGSPRDIRMTAVRDMLRSRAARMGDLLEAQKVGGLQDPTFMELAEFGSDNPIQRRRHMHESASLMENQSLKMYGFMPEPIEGEDHGIHIEMVDRVINYLRTAQPGSPLIALALQHRRAHQMTQAMELVQQQMDQQNAMMQQQSAAAGFGAANAADPMAQPPDAVAGAENAGAVPPGSADNLMAGASAPGTQPSIRAADQRAIATAAGAPKAA